MGHAAGTEENFPFANGHDLPALICRLEMELDVAVDLIEKFFAGLEVKVEPRVWPVQHHDDEILMVRDDAVGLKGRLEEMPVLFNPALQVGRGKKIRHGSDDNTPADSALLPQDSSVKPCQYVKCISHTGTNRPRGTSPDMLDLVNLASSPSLCEMHFTS